MCHEHRGYASMRDRFEAEQESEDEEDELPSFANEEAEGDLEVLTDGGDES